MPIDSSDHSFKDGRTDSGFRFKFGGYLTILLTVLMSCDYAFDPLLPNTTLHYTIYGTLDASRDTQVIRVGPVRTTTRSIPDPIDATVTLEHLGSGKTDTLRDSLYAYGEDSWAWNFITIMDIEPEESYRLTATRSDGVSSYLVTSTPETFIEPRYVTSCFRGGITHLEFYINDVYRLVVFDMVYQYVSGFRLHTQSISHMENVRYPAGGGQRILVRLADDAEKLAANGGHESVDIDSISVYMVSAGPDWPMTEGVTIEQLTLPSVVRNVENGVGVVAGIVSKSFPIINDCIVL